MWLSLALLAAFLTILFVRRPDWGLAAMVFLLPFERIGSFALNESTGHPILRPIQVVAAAWTIAQLYNVLTGRLLLRRLPGWVYLLAFTVWAGLSSVAVNYPRVWINYTWLIFTLVLVFLIAQVVSKELLPKLAKALFASTIVVCVFGLYQYLGDVAGLSTAMTGLREAYTSKILGFPRIQSTALEPLYYANFLLIPLFLSLSWMIESRQRLRGWQWLGLYVLGLNFVLTMSRGAFASCLAGLVIIFAVYGKRLFSRHLVKQAGLLSLAILLSAGALTAIASFRSRGSFSAGPQMFSELNSPAVTQTSSYIDRSQQIAQAWRVFWQEPILGVGLGGIAPKLNNYPSERRPDDYAVFNNESLELLVQVGSVGWVIYLIFLSSLLRRGFKSAASGDPDTRFWVAGLMATIIATFVQSHTFSGFFITYRWVVIGLLIGLVSAGPNFRFSPAKLKDLL